MTIPTVDALKSIRGKRVLVRVDFNTPMEHGKVTDDSRIVAALPTIKFLLGKGAKVILMSHFGRPAAKRESRIMNHELRVVVERLNSLLGRKAQVIDEWDFGRIRQAVKKMKAGGVLMLPNLRLHPGEEKNSSAFAREIAELGQIYVNEAFSVCHRKHASVVGASKLMPAYGGFQLMRELEVLSGLLRKPKKPLVALMGGAKIETKLGLIKRLVRIADCVLVGGALATHFFKAMGYEVGASRVEVKEVRMAKKLVGNKKIVLPKDVVVGRADGEGAQVVDVSANSKEQRAKSSTPYALCSHPYGIWDIGPRTILEFAERIKSAKTLVWNGPLGLYEVKRYSHGTLALGRLFAARSRGKAFGVVGGGETIDALKMTGMGKYVDFVSTGGGAMLVFLAGKKLPGLEVLHKGAGH